VIAYFDTSALIKLVIAEDGTDQAKLLWQQAGEVVVSRLAWPEGIAALAAAHRGRRVSGSGARLCSCLTPTRVGPPLLPAADLSARPRDAPPRRLAARTFIACRCSGDTAATRGPGSSNTRRDIAGGSSGIVDQRHRGAAEDVDVGDDTAHATSSSWAETKRPDRSTLVHRGRPGLQDVRRVQPEGRPTSRRLCWVALRPAAGIGDHPVPSGTPRGTRRQVATSLAGLRLGADGPDRRASSLDTADDR
jgi:hypothetical protein